jgi:hypothetical protein
MTRPRLLRSAFPVAATLTVLLVMQPAPARAKVASSQTIVTSGDTLSFNMLSEDGCIRSVISVLVSQSVDHPGGGQRSAGGNVFYIRENECTDEYLVGINQSFEIDSSALSANGDLAYGAAQFTTSAINEATHEWIDVTVDVTFTANGDTLHNHDHSIFYIDDVGYTVQDSEWSRPAVVTGTFSVGGVASTASGDGSASRGHSTTVIQTFGPPFPQGH